MQNLMVDALIRVRMTDGRTDAMSLPEVYASMVTDRVAAFPALRGHQRHAWHALLAQLGVLALHRAGRTAIPAQAGAWRALLRDLTPESPGDEPWHLVVDRTDQPAFMQCPAPGGLGAYRSACKTTPDDLDLLVTSKNHEQKVSVAVRSAPDDWLFALVDLQTMAGFMGGGHYPIARMNRGFSSRPCLGLAPADRGPGSHLVHDMRGMLVARAALLDRYSFEPDTGLALVWTMPWDGTTALDLSQLDPYFVEVCRRVRLLSGGAGIVALLAPTKCARIDAKALNGDVGDFWTPVTVKDRKALSVSEVGFTYDRLLMLLLAGRIYTLPPAMHVDPAASNRWRLVARGVAGGRGMTSGYHERTDIVLSAETVAALLGGEGRAELIRLADTQMDEVGEVRLALQFAVQIAVSGGEASEALGEKDRDRAEAYTRRLDAVTDRLFFEALDARFRARATDPRAAADRRRAFAQSLIDAAVRLLGEATATGVCPVLRRPRARLQAWRAFWGSLRRPESVFAGRQSDIVPSTDTTDGLVVGRDVTADPGCDVAGIADEIAGLDRRTVAALRHGPLATAATTTLVRSLVGRHASGATDTVDIAAAARLVQVIAILTPKGSTGQSAHRSTRTLGAALVAAGFSESSLSRAFVDPHTTQPALLLRACRQLAAVAPLFDLRLLARLLLVGDDACKREITREYVRAQFAALMPTKPDREPF